MRVRHPSADATLAEAAGLATRLGCPPVSDAVARLRRLPARSTRRASSSGVQLTARETAVLTLLSRGRTDPEIAAELRMSVRTTGSHVSSILRKLGVENRTQVAAAARAAGVLPGHGSKPPVD